MPSWPMAMPSSTAMVLNSFATPPAASIRLQKWQPDAPYAVRMNSASGADVYRIYLDEKPGYASSRTLKRAVDAYDQFVATVESQMVSAWLRQVTSLKESE